MQLFSNLNHVLAEIETMLIGLFLCSLAMSLDTSIRMMQIFYKIICS